VTRWGLLLLVAYIALGLSGLESRRAMRLMLWVTVVVIGFVSVKVHLL
jgi:hypothetical protein